MGDSVLEKAAGIESGSLIGFYQVVSQSESCNQQTNYTLSSQIGADHHQDKSFKQKPVQDLKSLTCRERDPTTRKSLTCQEKDPRLKSLTYQERDPTLKSLTCQEKRTKLVSIDKLTSPSPVLGEATSAAVGR